MLTGLIIGSLGLMIAMAMVQWMIVGRYLRLMRSMDSQAQIQDALNRLGARPKVDVLLSIRGAENTLEENLLSLLGQNYPEFQLHVILDAPDDPARQVIEQVRQAAPDRLTVHFLDKTNVSGGLKPMALAQVARHRLSSADAPDILAFTDADTRQSPDWLKRLVVALSSREKCGAVTGNRWYSLPNRPQTSTVVRSLWNLASLPQMHLYRVVWGGSWAIKRNVLTESGLLDAWEQALFEDTMVDRYVDRVGYRVQTVPGLYSTSEDPSPMPATRNWMFRQMLDLRLYHWAFPMVLGHAAGSALMAALPLVYGILLLTEAHRGWALIAIGVSLAYQISNGVIWQAIAATARQCLQTLDLPQGNRQLPWRTAFRAMVLTQFVYPATMVQVLMARSVVWRGVHYAWETSHQIRRWNDGPYTRTPEATDSHDVSEVVTPRVP